MKFRGEVFSGIGKGSYYVGHPEYQKRFEKALGYMPYPGTLNIKLEEGESRSQILTLRSMPGVKIAGFKVGAESFSALTCFQGELQGEKVTLLQIDVTHYNDSVVELISPTYLRGKFGLNDGDVVGFSLNSIR